MGRLLGWLDGRGSRTWIDVGGVDEFPTDTVRTITCRGTRVGVYHINGALHALGDVCPHMGASLGDGVVGDDMAVTCPAHALSFDLETGKCLEDSNYGVRTYRTRTHRGRVEVLV